MALGRSTISKSLLALTFGTAPLNNSYDFLEYDFMTPTTRWHQGKYPFPHRVRRFNLPSSCSHRGCYTIFNHFHMPSKHPRTLLASIWLICITCYILVARWAASIPGTD
jgi:hypothetical protein